MDEPLRAHEPDDILVDESVTVPTGRERATMETHRHNVPDRPEEMRVLAPTRGRRPQIAILVFLLGSFVPFVARAFSYRMAVAMAVIAGYSIHYPVDTPPGTVAPLESYVVVTQEPDPWGRPLCSVLVRETSAAAGPSVIIYSAGPNGRDEGRTGDDIVPTEREYLGAALLWWTRSLGVDLAIVVAWFAWGPFARSPRARLRTEALRAFVRAIVPALLPIATWEYVWANPFNNSEFAFHFTVLVRDVCREFISRSGLPSFVPPEAAFAVTWALAFWLPSFAWHLRRREASDS